MTSETMTENGFAESVKSHTAESLKSAFELYDLPDQDSKPSSKGSAAEDTELFEGHDQEQIRLMDEMCIVLDWDDIPVGAASKKTCHLMSNINRGLLHRAFSVFLFNRENKLLLQQRADEKITFPGMWTNTCCSHPLAVNSELGSSSGQLDKSVQGAKVAAQRKLLHELGISAEYIPIEKFNFLTRIHYVAPSDGKWGEHEIDYILIIRADPRISVNDNEVKDTRYVSSSELRAMFQDPNLAFTPWFKLICETYLYKWWGNLSHLDESHAETSIQHML